MVNVADEHLYGKNIFFSFVEKDFSQLRSLSL